METSGSKKKITNFDVIMQMTDEQFAHFLCDLITDGVGDGESCDYCCKRDLCHSGHNGFLEWLKMEASI